MCATIFATTETHMPGDLQTINPQEVKALQNLYTGWHSKRPYKGSEFTLHAAIETVAGGVWLDQFGENQLTPAYSSNPPTFIDLARAQLELDLQIPRTLREADSQETALSQRRTVVNLISTKYPQQIKMLLKNLRENITNGNNTVLQEWDKHQEDHGVALLQTCVDYFLHEATAQELKRIQTKPKKSFYPLSMLKDIAAPVARSLVPVTTRGSTSGGRFFGS